MQAIYKHNFLINKLYNPRTIAMEEQTENQLNNWIAPSNGYIVVQDTSSAVSKDKLLYVAEKVKFWCVLSPTAALGRVPYSVRAALNLSTAFWKPH